MATTDSRSGFRLPWNSDRSHDAQPADELPAPTEDAGEPAADAVAWPQTDFNAVVGVVPQQRDPDPVTVEASPEATAAPQEPAMVESASLAPAPAAPKKPSKLMVDLAAAIRATAEAARDQALAQVDSDVAVVVDGIRAGSGDGEAAIHAQSEQDIAAIREWSKAEIARIKEETESQIGARKATLEEELHAHTAAIEARVAEVVGAADSYRSEMAAYSDRLEREDDPARLATMAETMPEPPSLEAWSDLETLDTSAFMGAVDEDQPAVGDDEQAEYLSDDQPLAAYVAEPVVEDAPAEGVEADGWDAEPVAEVEAVVEAEAPATLEAEAEIAVEEPEAVAEPATSPWGNPDPWAPRDTTPLAEDAGDNVPRWAEGETPEGFPTPVEGGDPVDRGAIMAALEAAAEAVVAAESAAESADQAEAAADVAETAAELLKGRAESGEDDPEAQAAFSARVDAGGFDTESFTDRLASLLPGHEDASGETGPRTTQVVVSGLVSVASIASFKRHLGRLPGVTAVAVASGPDGEFMFNVNHGSDVSFRDAIPTMPGFAARVTSVADGVVSVTARDPEAEG